MKLILKLNTVAKATNIYSDSSRNTVNANICIVRGTIVSPFESER